MNWGIMFLPYVQNVTKRAFFSPTNIIFTWLALSSANFAVAYTKQDFSLVINSQERKIDEIRDQEIQQLQLVLSRSAPTDKQPDFLLRLAELYTEKYRLYFFKENELWSRKMDAYLQLPLSQQKQTSKPLLENYSSKNWLGKAVDTLEKIPLQRGKYERLDEVYYFLGFNLWELGKRKESVDNFQKIVSFYPQSRFSAEAYRYIADFAFASRDFERSRSLYEQASKFDNTPAKPRVLYGLAWSYFKLKNYKSALSTMREAISTAKEQAETSKTTVSIQRDAIDSLILFYTEGGNVDQATAFFNQLYGEQETAAMLKRLANTYQQQGKYVNALNVNKQILALGGAAAKGSIGQRYEIMEDSLKVASNKGERTRESALLKTMIGEFVVNAKETDDQRTEVLRNKLRKAALLAHKEGDKSKSPTDAYNRAEALYSLYLSAYAGKMPPGDAAEIRFYLAYVLSQNGKPREAAQEYRFILDKAQSESEYKRYQKESAAGMIEALDKYFKSKEASKSLSRDDADNLISAIDFYVRLYPNDKDTVKFLARAAGILVTGKRMEEARPRLKKIVESYPSTKTAWDAASNLLKDAEDRKDYVEAEKISREFLANKPLMAQDKNAEFRKRLDSIVSRAQFLQVKSVEDKQNYVDAAKGYENLAEKSKDPEVRTKAMNNAAVTYARSNDRVNERRIYLRILQGNLGNELAERAILNIANEYLLAGNYSEAADTFEVFYQTFEPKLAQMKESTQTAALESLRSAVLLRQGLGQNEKAADDFKRMVEASNKGLGQAREIAGEFLFEFAKKILKDGNAAEAAKAYSRYLAVFPKGAHAVESHLELALLYRDLRDEEKSKENFLNAIKIVKVKDGTANADEVGFAARAKLELLAPMEAQLENAPIRLPEKQLSVDIKARFALLEKMIKSYTEVIEYGDGAMGVEAFRRLAMAYRSAAQKLENAPIPEEKSLEEKAIFKAKLKQVAQPVYAKVSETLESALKKGEALLVVGPSMAKVYVMAVLTSARPDRYPLIWDTNWENPREWILGSIPNDEVELEKSRSLLKTNPSDINAWISVGNYHVHKSQNKMAEIFYLQALKKSPKSIAAINNLAYLKGREGEIQKAMAGFKKVLAIDEFAIQAKKNIARLQMASGLWRHASLAYRQLEVRVPEDKEVKRGLLLSNLAEGKTSGVEAQIATTAVDSDNGKFVSAVLQIAKNDQAAASAIFQELSARNENAKLILSFWNKEKL